jgi:hypothetical protein
LIEPRGKGYAVPAFAARMRSRIVLLVDMNQLPIGNDRIRAIIELLEVACTHAGVTLDIAVMRTIGPDMHLIDTASGKDFDLRRSDNVLGYVNLINMTFNLQQFLPSVVACGKPVAVIQQSHDKELERFVSAHANCRRFRIGLTAAPVVKLAEYLLSLGHCRVAYFSAYIDAQWSQIRQKCLEDTFAHAGFSNAVSAHVMPRSAYASTIESFAAVADSWLEWIRNAPAVHRESLSELAMQLSGGALFEPAEHRIALHALFRKALRKKDITAWVAGEPHTGVALKQFLTKERIAVPAAISIAAIDDAPEAIHERLTCMNLNHPALVNALMGYILRTPVPFALRKRGTIEMEGMLIDRGSVGNARRHPAQPKAS